MFINFQNNGAEVLANLLSGDVRTNDAMIGENSNFDSLLASLVNAAVSGDSVDESSAESPKPFAAAGEDVPVTLNASSVIIRPENVSVMADVEMSGGQSADRLIKIDAELVMESENGKTSIPAAVFLMEKTGETESGMAAMFLLLNTDGLSSEDVETLSNLLNGNAVNSDKLSEIPAASETIMTPEQAISLTEIKSNTETDDVRHTTPDIELDETDKDTDLNGMYAYGETPKTVEIPESETDIESPVFIDNEKAQVVSGNDNEKVKSEPKTEPDIIKKAELNGNNELNNNESPISQLTNALASEINTLINNAAQNEIGIPDVGIYIRNITVESGNAETDILRLVIETPSDEPSLSIEPKTTDSLEKPIAELIKQHVQPGETIEITIVVKKETQAGTMEVQVSETAEENQAAKIQTQDNDGIIQAVKTTDENSNETKTANSVSNNHVSTPNENEITAVARSHELQETSENETAVKTNNKIENYSKQNNPEPLPSDTARIDNKADIANAARIASAPETSHGEINGKTVEENQVNKDSVETAKPQAPETKITKEIGVSREYMLHQSANKAETHVQPTGNNVIEEIVTGAGTENKTAKAESEIIVNSTPKKITSDNPVPVDSSKETSADGINSNADTENIVGTKNSTVEANILFNRTQREITERVKITHNETTQPVIKSIKGENAVKSETETGNTVIRTETGTVETAEYSTQSVKTDSGKAVIQHETEVTENKSAVKMPANEITSKRELMSEPVQKEISEKIPESTSLAIPNKDITLNTSQKNKFDMVSINENILEEGAPVESAVLSKPGQAAESAINSSGDKPDSKASGKEAIVSGYNNTPEYTSGKKSLDGISDSRKNFQTEAESDNSGKMTTDAVVMDAQNEFGENQEFLKKDGTFTGQSSDIENISGDNAARAESGENGKVFGLPPVTENVDNAQQTNVVENKENSVHTNVPGEIDEKKVLESIVRQARFMNQKELSKADIKLEPPHLGKLRIELVSENSKITGKITVDSLEVKEIIQNSISELRENLAQSGLKVDSFDVNIGHNNGSDLWERMQKFKTASNNTQNISTLSDSTDNPAMDPFLTKRPARTISDYSDSFDVVV